MHNSQFLGRSMAIEYAIVYLRIMRTALYYTLYATLLILIFGGIFLGTEFYPDETTFGMFAFVGLCAVWKVASIAWGFWWDARFLKQQKRDRELAKMIARETVLELDRMRRERA